MNRHLAVDIDGTCAEFTRASAELICWMADEHFAFPEVHAMCESEWSGPSLACDLMGVDREHFWWLIFTEKWTDRLEPVPGAAYFLGEAAASGYTVAYRTARHEATRPLIERWLYRHGFPSATNVTCQGGTDKVSGCRAMMEAGQEVVLIDDAPDTVAAAVASGVPIIVPVHPYNADVLQPPAVPLPAWPHLMGALEGVFACR